MFFASWQWTPYMLPLIVGSAVTVILAIHIIDLHGYQLRTRVGVVMLFASAVWAVGYVLELASPGLEQKLFWAKAQYTGIVVFPVAWFAYASIYTGRRHWLTRRKVAGLVVIPAAALLLAITNDRHGLMWKAATLDTQGPIASLDQAFGAGFWLFWSYAVALVLGGGGVLAQAFARAPRIYRRQMWALVSAALVMVLFTTLDATDLSPLPWLDLEPYAFTIVSLLIAFGLLGLQLGDVVPVAYASVVQGMPDGVIVLDTRGRVVQLNDAAQEIFGLDTELAVGRTWSSLTSALPLSLSTERPGDQGVEHHEIQIGEGDRTRHYEARVSSLIRDGFPCAQVVVVRDISERRQAEIESRERQRYLETVLTAAPDAIVTLNPQARIVEWNNGAERLFGYSRSEALGQELDHLVTGPNGAAEAHRLTQLVIGGQVLAPFETVRYRNNGSPVPVVVAAAPIRVDGSIAGAVAVYSDVTPVKVTEEALRRLNQELEQRVEERTAALTAANARLSQEIDERRRAEQALLLRNRELLSLQSAATATSSVLDLPFVLDTVTWEMTDLLQVDGCTIFDWDRESDRISVMAAHADPGAPDEPPPSYALSGYSMRRSALAERFAQQVLAGQPDSDPAEQAYMQAAGIRSMLVLPMVFQDRVVGLVEMSDSVQARTFTDHEISIAQLLANQAAIAIENARLYERAQQEIVERQRTEAQITEALEEKVVLLKEIHHRVKNNLQIISSLLNLQIRNIEDQDAREVFRDSQNRVRSMALIHEKLYRSADLARVDFGEYIQSLAAFLVRSYRTQSSLVSLKAQVGDVLLSINDAVPCGLIVNELITNSLKYAFCDGRQGEVYVRLYANGAERITLVVGDNGVGFPEEVDFRHTDSLGLQLVNSLVRQLDGDIALSRESGTAFEISFKAS